MERDESLLDYSTLATVQLTHDLQNLLAIMSSCVDALTPRGSADSGETRALDELSAAVDGAFRVTDELLAIVGLGRCAEPIALDFNDLLTRYRGMMERMIGERARLVMRTDPATLPVVAAPAQLEWMLLNLVANARDAMPDGGLVFIETAAIERWMGPIEAPTRKERYLRLTVRDEGTGVSDDLKSRMFEPFFTTKQHGNGLGLTSVAITVRALGGWLYVESGDDGGTSVHVLLPLHGRTCRADRRSKS